MNERPGRSTQNAPTLGEQVAAKAVRKLKARRNSAQGVWFGLGMMGLIGWSVVVPTLLGASLGIWLDHRHAGRHSWTLALLMAGLTLGCMNAWHWVAKEDEAMHEEQTEDRDEEKDNGDE
jgi:ATP synthase protein I